MTAVKTSQTQYFILFSDVTEPNTSDNLEIKEEPIEPDDALVALTEDPGSQPGCLSPGPEAIPVDHL